MEEKPIIITVNSPYSDKGSVSGGGEYKQGDTVTITATPKTGYAFNYWTNQYGSKISDAGATYTFTATESGTFNAWFKDDISSATYTVNFNANGGSGKMDAVTITEGEKLTLPECTFTAPKGKEFDRWEAGMPGEQVDVTADSVIRAVWKEKTAANPFTDVAAGAYYYEPILWAVSHDPQITNGTDATHFSPNATCTRGQVVTFMWRAAGCPKPACNKNPFTDVKSSDYYYKAVLWAVNHKPQITNGTGATTFSPDTTCTRGQIVTFLYRDMG